MEDVSPDDFKSAETTADIVFPVTQATKIDVRVGAILDGAIVYFDDGHEVVCGPRYIDGSEHHIGMNE